MTYMKTEYRRSKAAFINPYTFVPTPRNVKVKREKLEAGSLAKLHTGVLRCALFVKTPVGIPDGELAKKTNVKDHLEYPFFSYMEGGKRTLAIPGSSIRGSLRSVFEAATDSCFSTLRDNTGLSRRVSNREAYKPGILRWEKDRWHLYKADRYLLAADPNGKGAGFVDRNYKKFDELPVDAYVTISRKGKDGPRIVITKDREELRFGDEIEFFACTDGKAAYKKGNFSIWSGVAKDIRKNPAGTGKTPGRKNGLVYIGETFNRKHGESVFTCGPEEKRLGAEELKAAYEGLLETLDIYRNPAINRSKGHSGYEDFEHAKKETGIPVWYNAADKKLSLASIGRSFFRTSLNELVGERKPCVSRKELCEACSLFGMTGDESLGSRIRVADAKAVGEYKTEKFTLKILGQPRYSYMPFYARFTSDTQVASNTRSLPYPQSYDDDNVEIGGRKFYWHNKMAAEDNSIYSVGYNNRNNMNSTMELVMPGAEFRFDIYYDGITEGQLEKLMWCLNFGENQKDGDLCHKIGHGKPLGLGSVKIVIEENAERVFDGGVYAWKKETPSPDGTEPELRNKAFVKRVASFKGPGEDVPIMYPDVYDENGRPFSEPRGNDEARHVWYAKNKDVKRDKNDPIELLPDVKKKDQTLHAYEKARGGTNPRGGGQR